MNLINDDIDFSSYMAEPAPAHRVLSASSWKQDLVDHFFAPRDRPRVTMGWQKTQADFDFREGELSLWAGINGHGKSLLHSQVALDLLIQNEKVCIASLELRPAKLMARMAKQASGCGEPSIDYLKRFADWTDDRMWLYDHFGTSSPSTMLGVIRYSVDQFQIRHFVIDNLMKVVAGEDDYNAQKDFVNSLAAIAKDTGAHIHLIAHMKKGRSETDVPGKWDIKGSGSLTDIADNVFVVWRNKAKEDAFRTGADFEPEAPDAMLIINKQRNSEGEMDEGAYSLFFDRPSNQYMERRTDIPKSYRLESGIDLSEVTF